MLSSIGKITALFFLVVGGGVTIYALYKSFSSLIKPPILIKDQDISQEDYVNRYKK